VKKKWEIGDLTDFELRHMIDACLAGASVAMTAILLGASRVTVPEVMSA
jgi:hypothetical protein